MMEAAELAGIIRDTVAREVAARMDGLRAAFDLSIKTIQPGADGRNGVDGRDGADGREGAKGLDGSAGRDGIDGKDGAPGAPGRDGEKGADGRDGVDGKDGAPGLAGKDGAPGKDGQKGADGIDGRNGADGRDGKDGAPGLEGQKGADGINGRDGSPGPQGEKGVDGVNGRDGAPGPEGQKGMDGRSVTIEEVLPIIEGGFSKWVLEFERRATDTMQKAIDRIPVPKDGRDGIDGRNGADGLGFDDAVVEKNGPRGFAVVMKNAEREKRFDFAFPIVLDAGVFKGGTSYEAGDGVTYGGSWWIAQKATSEVPGNSDAWRLAVKRGRDGKDAS